MGRIEPPKPLVENEDYYLLPDGRLVFTRKYLLKRGFCCGNGCMNCPYDFMNVPEPERSRLRLIREENKTD
jgi:hypothetical protein